MIAGVGVLRQAGFLRLAAGLALAALAAASLAQSPAAPPLPARGTVQVAFTPWDDAERMIAEAIGAAKRQILVQAYSFTSRSIAAALIAARARGVDVRVTADREQAFSGDNSRIPAIAAAGIPVLIEVRYQSAHNKAMIIDAGSADAAVITGSYNWTFAAQNRNAENVLIFRRNADLAMLYFSNWQRHAQDALPFDLVRQP